VAWVFWKIDRKTILAGSQHTSDHDFYLILSVKGALMVYLIQIFISFGVITTMTHFFLFLGLAWTLTEDENTVRTVKLKSIPKFMAVFFVLLLTSFGFVFAYKEASAEIYYKAAVVAESRNDLKGAIENYQNTVLTKPNEFGYHQAFADFALKNSTASGLSADAKEKMLWLAEVHYGTASVINPYHPSVYYNLGLAEVKLYLSNKEGVHLERAELVFDKAVELAVNNPLYPAQIAKILQTLPFPKLQAEAADYLKAAEQIRPGYTAGATATPATAPAPVAK
jgi:tetratricopeptide (TPR) repeat protein